MDSQKVEVNRCDAEKTIIIINRHFDLSPLMAAPSREQATPLQ